MSVAASSQGAALVQIADRWPKARRGSEARGEKPTRSSGSSAPPERGANGPTTHGPCQQGHAVGTSRLGSPRAHSGLQQPPYSERPAQRQPAFLQPWDDIVSATASSSRTSFSSSSAPARCRSMPPVIREGQSNPRAIAKLARVPTQPPERCSFYKAGSAMCSAYTQPSRGEARAVAPELGTCLASLAWRAPGRAMLHGVRHGRAQPDLGRCVPVLARALPRIPAGVGSRAGPPGIEPRVRLFVALRA